MFGTYYHNGAICRRWLPSFILHALVVIRHPWYVLVGRGVFIDSWLYSISVLNDLLLMELPTEYEMDFCCLDFREYVLNMMRGNPYWPTMVSARVDAMYRFRKHHRSDEMSNMMTLIRHHGDAAKTLYRVNAAYIMAVYDTWKEGSMPNPHPYIQQGYDDYYDVLCSSWDFTSYMGHRHDIRDADIVNAVFIGNAYAAYMNPAVRAINADYDDITGKYFSSMDPSATLRISDDSFIDSSATLCAYHESKEHHADFVSVYNQVSTIIGDVYSRSEEFCHAGLVLYMPLSGWLTASHSLLNGSLLAVMIKMVARSVANVGADDVSWACDLDYRSFPTSQQVLAVVDEMTRLHGVPDPCSCKTPDRINLVIRSLASRHDATGMRALNALYSMIQAAEEQAGMDDPIMVMSMGDFRALMVNIFDNGSMDFGVGVLAMDMLAMDDTTQYDVDGDTGCLADALVDISSLHIVPDA